MPERVFLDTNILLYSVDEAAAGASKRAVAEELLRGPNCTLSVQVLQEFFNQATRPSRQYRLAADQAWRLIGTWRRFPVQENTLALLDLAYVVHRRDRFSWWDSLIVAAAQAQGCEILYTEDMQHGRIIDGLRILDPFRQESGLVAPWPA